eukprot:TRINITY_DN739_c8_g1_i1.p1 TRINITY_DN739_c8_g1~~TRINITY_DN739_c8_g1_i1.p1  ORF type:complete len:700 (+),score=133.76 TRINITY_DN739_c8_g1_i1:74-2173(+)
MNNLLPLLSLVTLSLGAEVCQDYTLATDNDYNVCWEVKNDEVHLKLTVKTEGWIGFGIGEYAAGGMLGADIAMISNNVITDMFTKEERVTPLKDDCNAASDWDLESHEVSAGKTVAVIKRKLAVQDSQTDRSIEAGTTRVILAYGETNTFTYHGNQRLPTAITFIPGPVIDYGTEGDRTGILSMEGFKVPTKRTIYGCRGFDLHALYPELANTVHHITSIETIPVDGNYQSHHAVLYACANSPNQLDAPDLCGNNPCDELLYAWAVGGEKIRFPGVAGLPIGGDTGYRYLSLEFHYDNPKLVSDNDASYVKFTYTSVLRRHDVQVLWLGDPKVAMSVVTEDGIAPKERTHYEMDCNSDCTSRFTTPTKIFNIFLHMHTIGKRIRLVHSQGSNSKEIIRSDYYDFDLQHAIPIPETVIQPGDQLTTHCEFYHEGNENVYFGSGSNEEMCMIFAYSYPKAAKQGHCGLYSCASGLQVSNTQYKERSPMVALSFGDKAGCKYTSDDPPEAITCPNGEVLEEIEYSIEVDLENNQEIKIKVTTSMLTSVQTIEIQSPVDKWVGFAPVSVATATSGKQVMNGATAVIYKKDATKQESVLVSGSLGSSPASSVFTQMSMVELSGVRKIVLTSQSVSVMKQQASASLIAWGDALEYHGQNRRRVFPAVDSFKCKPILQSTPTPSNANQCLFSTVIMFFCAIVFLVL